jgi:hypothetical protein
MESGLAPAHHQILGATVTGGMADLKIVGHQASTDHATTTVTADHHATTTGDLHHRHQKAVEGQIGATAATSLLPQAKADTHFPHRLATVQTGATEEGTKLHQETHTYPATKVVAEIAHAALANQTTASNDADPAIQATRVTATQTSGVPTARTDDQATLETSPAIGETVEHDHVVRIGGTTEMEETRAITGAGTMISTGDGRSSIQNTAITIILEGFGGSRLVVGRGFFL